MNSYFSFTVMHDAVHNSISSNKIFNDFIGSTSSIILSPISSYNAFKYIHKKHHLYVNTKKDPDYWISHSSNHIIHKCVLQIPYYWFYIFKIYLYGEIDIKTFFQSIYQIIILIFTYMTFYVFNFNYSLYIIYYYMFLPSLISIPLLSLMLTYLPHKNMGYKDKYKTSSIIKLKYVSEFFTSIIMANQNYHIIHHLNPNIPFHQYKNYYLQNKDTIDLKINK